MDGFPSGQRGQTVNLLATLSVVRIHLHPLHAAVAELADAQDLKSCGTYTPVPVRFRFAALRNESKVFGLYSFLLKREIRDRFLSLMCLYSRETKRDTTLLTTNKEHKTRMFTIEEITLRE